MSDEFRRSRRPREVIEHFDGGYLVDYLGGRSIEQSEVVASIILRMWPDVAMHIAAAWRPADQEETVE